MKGPHNRKRAGLIARAYVTARRQAEREHGPGAVVLPPVARLCAVGPGRIVLRNHWQDLATFRVTAPAIRFAGGADVRIAGGQNTNGGPRE